MCIRDRLCLHFNDGFDYNYDEVNLDSKPKGKMSLKQTTYSILFGTLLCCPMAVSYTHLECTSGRRNCQTADADGDTHYHQRIRYESDGFGRLHDHHPPAEKYQMCIRDSAVYAFFPRREIFKDGRARRGA